MANGPLNRTEEFVLSLCKRTCLSMWSCSNPFAEKGKELCDVLVVCDPHVIIISVKDILLHEDKDSGLERWERKAIDTSVKQIYGGERSLLNISKVTFNDGAQGLDLPAVSLRKIHRIAVAFGSKGVVPIKSGDFGKGFVHVMHEQSFCDVLEELDTISDLIAYLTAKEECTSQSRVIVEGSEANLLGWYLFNSRAFPSGNNVLMVDDTIWKQLNERPEWKRRKEADEVSYAWDKLVEMLSDSTAQPVNGPAPAVSDLERALRSMAKETRFNRRILGKALREFFKGAKERKLRSRIVVSPSGVIYVIVYFLPKDKYVNRTPELALRCVAARKAVSSGSIVVGVGIGEHEPERGSTSDLVYFEMEDWTNFIRKSEPALKTMKFFEGQSPQLSHHDEYPDEKR